MVALILRSRGLRFEGCFGDDCGEEGSSGGESRSCCDGASAFGTCCTAGLK